MAAVVGAGLERGLAVAGPSRPRLRSVSWTSARRAGAEDQGWTPVRTAELVWRRFGVECTLAGLDSAAALDGPRVRVFWCEGVRVGAGLGWVGRLFVSLGVVRAPSRYVLGVQ